MAARIQDGIVTKSNEPFQRLTPRALAALMLQGAETCDFQYWEDVFVKERQSNPNANVLKRQITLSDRQSSRENMSRIMKAHADITPDMASAAESDGGAHRSDAPEPTHSALPLLILDVREPAEFEECHIVTSKNYPVSTLSRSFQFSGEVLRLKNSPSVLIVIVDEDERTSSAMIRFFVERGYENVRLLSGGISTLARRVHGVLVGVPPVRWFSPPTQAPSAQSKGDSLSHHSKKGRASPHAPQRGQSHALTDPEHDNSIVVVKNTQPAERWNVEALKFSLEAINAATAKLPRSPAPSKPPSPHPSPSQSMDPSRCSTPDSLAHGVGTRTSSTRTTPLVSGRSTPAGTNESEYAAEMTLQTFKSTPPIRSRVLGGGLRK
ncbi:uncharacterized protein BJ171DRAFT_180515 [Polychytrium aggregatum]|uniref:uncharacterized protein n=1 Tax=Polychytrium aggregatum TaxID=110093 RepID=UPI0022FEF212|nr:uncharacterized protein BJ171DRAFT_180515 [Polychytrium aggregatum]KAI9202456.1 hypothetical protein BJ171DRAFT_180515 [Polychytrium aggregatum]